MPIECFRCRGESDDCEHCEGTGLVHTKRCGRHDDLGVDGDTVRLLALAMDGNWPVEGGTVVQSRSFLIGLSIFRAAVRDAEEFEMEESRLAAQREQKKRSR